ncbi:MAG: DoxX family protein, partial [Ginsengibacter sp.]
MFGWISTFIFAALMIFSAAGGLQPSLQAIQIIHDGLGYPIYFIQFISIAKLLGAIIILIPGLNRIKEWAYAGLFFDLAGAVYSGVASTGKFDP